MAITINVTRILVEDQAHARAFYADVLGFVQNADVPVGEFRWLTVVSPQQPDGVELLLEPNVHPAARSYQTAVARDRIPATRSWTIWPRRRQGCPRRASGSTPNRLRSRGEFAIIDAREPDSAQPCARRISLGQIWHGAPRPDLGCECMCKDDTQHGIGLARRIPASRASWQPHVVSSSRPTSTN